MEVVDLNEAVDGVCLIERGGFEVSEGVRDTVRVKRVSLNGREGRERREGLLMDQ